MGLAAIVDLVGADLLEDPSQPGAVGDVAVVKEESRARIVQVAVQVFQAFGVEGARLADDPVNLLTFRNEKLREVRAVLSGDSCDERAFQRERGGRNTARG